MRAVWLALMLMGVLWGSGARAVELEKVSLELSNPAAVRMLNAALDDGYWDGAWSRKYTGEKYDEIRLKSEDGGYVPMITGEGDEDLDPDVVQHIVFKRMWRLPAYMEGARAVKTLGSGTAPNGDPFVDTFFFLDFTVFYATYTQRMYRKADPANKRTILYYEKLTPQMVSADTWSAYQAKIEAASAKVSLRWPPFNAVIPASDIYGMFIVSEGIEHTSRVTYITKVVFDDQTSWIARWGSKMPAVLRAGLRNGFNASVAIAHEEKMRRSEASGG